MSQKRTKDATHVQVLVSGVPQDLLTYFDRESYRVNGGKRGGGRKIGSGRSGLIIKAMETYRTDRKRRAHQNKERKAEKGAEV